MMRGFADLVEMVRIRLRVLVAFSSIPSSFDDGKMKGIEMNCGQ
jgi:hypothetical protein